eukprot:s198_g23.t1
MSTSGSSEVTPSSICRVGGSPIDQARLTRSSGVRMLAADSFDAKKPEEESPRQTSSEFGSVEESWLIQIGLTPIPGLTLGRDASGNGMAEKVRPKSKSPRAESKSKDQAREEPEEEGSEDGRKASREAMSRTTEPHQLE